MSSYLSLLAQLPVIDAFETKSDIDCRFPCISHGTTLVRLRINKGIRVQLTLDLRNPTLEDQALARIHRMGQTREVTTVRFCVRNSFEEVCFKPYGLCSYPIGH